MSAPARDLAQLRRYGDSIADAVRTEGEQLALAVSRDWADLAFEAIRRLADIGEPFTADDMTAACGPAPSPGASGAVFREAARQELIICIGFDTSRRVLRHGGIFRQWKGRT